MLWLELGILFVTLVLILVNTIYSFRVAAREQNKMKKKDIEMISILNLLALLLVVGVGVMLWVFTPHDKIHLSL